MKNLPAQRPAETTTALAAALAVLICAIFDVEDTTILSALTIVIGAIPAIVTSIVNLQRKRKTP